jgi:hypothetical protein
MRLFRGMRDSTADFHCLLVTVQMSFRPEGEIFCVTQISPRSTRRNDNHLNNYVY